MEQTIIKWVKIIECAGPLFEILLVALGLGLGGTWVGRLFYKLIKVKDDLTLIMDRSDLKNEDFARVAEEEGYEWGLEEIRRRLLPKK